MDRDKKEHCEERRPQGIEHRWTFGVGIGGVNRMKIEKGSQLRRNDEYRYTGEIRIRPAHGIKAVKPAMHPGQRAPEIMRNQSRRLDGSGLGHG
jgi:hypothetical protein